MHHEIRRTITVFVLGFATELTCYTLISVAISVIAYPTDNFTTNMSTLIKIWGIATMCRFVVLQPFFSLRLKTQRIKEGKLFLDVVLLDLIVAYLWAWAVALLFPPAINFLLSPPLFLPYFASLLTGSAAIFFIIKHKIHTPSGTPPEN